MDKFIAMKQTNTTSTTNGVSIHKFWSEIQQYYSQLNISYRNIVGLNLFNLYNTLYKSNTSIVEGIVFCNNIFVENEKKIVKHLSTLTQYNIIFVHVTVCNEPDLNIFNTILSYDFFKGLCNYIMLFPNIKVHVSRKCIKLGSTFIYQKLDIDNYISSKDFI